MRVVISPEVANNASVLNALIRIQHTFEDGWHVWDSEIEDLELLESSRWLQDPGYTGTSACELLRKSIARSAYPSSLHCRTLHVRDSVDGQLLALTPEKASRYLSQQFVILVEERGADGDFFKVAARHLADSELAEYLFHLENPAWRIDSRGGKGKMAEEVTVYCRECESTPRMMVIRDSDRRSPFATEDPEVQTLREKCAELRVPCWILRKREMENYLPSSLLKHRKEFDPKMEEVFAIWDRLSPEQKDFFDLRQKLAEDDIIYQQLLADLPTNEIDYLKQTSFGPKVGSTLWSAALCRKHEITAEELRERDRFGELDDLLAELRKHL